MFDSPLIPFDDDQWLSHLQHASEHVSFELPPLRRSAQRGVFLWWPEGMAPEDWIHPEDLELGQQLIPSNRVFQKQDLDHDFAEIRYGQLRVRIRSVIWLEITAENYQIGDFVEVKSELGKSRPFIGQIKDIVWNHLERCVEYRLTHLDNALRKLYPADQFQLVADIEGFLDQRKLELIQKSKIS